MPAFPSVIDLSDLPANVGRRFTGVAAYDSFGISISNAGDINGDGFDDFIIGAPGNDANGNNTGTAYVIFGHAGGIGALNFSAPLAAADGFRIFGDANDNDYAGRSVSGLGDVNGDGFDDLFVGAPFNNAGANQGGAGYVIFGHGGSFGDINLSTPLTAAEGFRILGDTSGYAGDRIGYSASSAGDINGDGFADIVFTSDDRYADGRNYPGNAIVVFGHGGGFSEIDLGAPLDPATGFQITGAADGARVVPSSAGDFNGDGYDDLILGSPGLGNRGSYSGAAYVIFGKASGFGPIDLATPLAANDGFRILGAVAEDRAGTSVSSAGDINGDGFGDILIGAPFNEAGGRYAGTTYVLFGHASGFGEIDLAMPLAANEGFRIIGSQERGAAGTSVSAAGDVNGDGFADIIIGVPHDGAGGPYAGAAYVIFGNAGGFGDINLANPLDGQDGFKVVGEHIFDEATDRDGVSAAGDVNGDGYDDILVSSYRNGPGYNRTGAAYVIYGHSTAVSAAPVLDLDSGSDGTGSVASFDEQGSVALAPAATVTDSDSPNFAGGHLIVAFSVDGTASDYLTARDDGGASSSSGHIGISGTDVYYNQIVIGTIASQGLGVPYEVDFNANATAAAVQALVRDIYTGNISDAPPPGGRDVVFTLTDGGGGSVTADAIVSITAVNDAPVLAVTGNAFTFTEGDPAHPLFASLAVSDPDNANFNGGTLTIADASSDSADHFVFSSNPDIVVDSNAGTVSYQGNIFGELSSSAGSLTVALNSFATPAAVQALLGVVDFANGADNPVGGDHAITVSLTDGAGGTGSFVTHVNVVPVNDNSVIANLDGDVVTYVENDPAAYVDAGATSTSQFVVPGPGNGLISDVDSQDFGGGSLSVSISAGAVAPEDRITFIGYTSQVANAISFSGGNIFYGSVQFATSSGSGAARTFTFNANATAQMVTALLHQVVFIDSSENPNTGDRTIQYVLTDGDGGSTTAHSTVHVTAVNDAPVNHVPAAQGVNEDATLTFAGGNAITVTDVDAGTGTVTTSLAVLHGTLTLGSTNNVVVANNGTGNVQLTGTTADVNAALSGLGYAPVANYNGADTLTVTTSDNGHSGAGGPQQDVDTIAINVAAVNDAPSGADHVVTDVQDQNYVFQIADFGFSDPIDGNAFNAVRVLSFPAHGTLFLDSDGPGGAAPVNLSSVGSGVFVSAADIAAGHLYFVPAAGGSGAGYASFIFAVQDDGGVARGGVDVDPTPNLITIDVTPVNHAPVVDLNTDTAGNNDTNIYLEGGSASAIGSDIAVTDADGDPVTGATVTITDFQAGDALVANLPLPGGITIQSNMNGVLVLTGSASAAAYSTALGQLGFASSSDDPTAGGHTTRTITVSAQDALATGPAAALTLTIFAVDDPAVARNDAVSTDEAHAISGNVFADNGSGADSDPDGPALTVAAVNDAAGNVGHQLTLASGALLTVDVNGTFAYDPNHAFDATPTLGSGASNTPASDSFTYTLTGGGSATVTVSIAGLDSNDLLLGTSGADTLIGGAGDDILVGGPGNDIYRADDSGDVIRENVGEGNDVVYAAVNYTLTAGSEIEVLAAIDPNATTALNLTGNEFDNIIIGNAGANTLIGGAGNDQLFGGAGNDIYRADDSGDVIREAVGGGNDVVYAAVSYALGAGSEIEVLAAIDPNATTALNLTGNEFDNIIIGNAGANTLIGGAGNDQMFGGAGNDIYRAEDAGDVIQEAVGQGNDTVYAAVSYSLGAGSEIEVLAALNPASTTGLTLIGNEFANIIIGGAGNDTLIGGAGNDQLFGGLGNDIYRADDAGDVIREAAGQGNDVVYAATSYRLGDGSEIEALIAIDPNATDAYHLTGNEFGNVIRGNAGANVIDGGAGNDVLAGLGGADTFQFTTALGANNVDVILDFTSGTDKLALDHNVFAGLATGALSASAFVNGTAATTADQHILYDQATGNLYFDADGNGAGAAVLFANLQTHPAITAADIQVI